MASTIAHVTRADKATVSISDAATAGRAITIIQAAQSSERRSAQAASDWARPMANRRGLTDEERALLGMLRDRLAVVGKEVERGLAENTVDHALPSLVSLTRVHQGAVVLRALLEEPLP